MAADLDAACLKETGQGAEERRNEARARLRAFLWKARTDFGIVTTPDGTRRLALLYRLEHDQSATPENIERRRELQGVASGIGLPDLHRQLREFAQDIGHAILVSPDPVKKLNSILYGPLVTAGRPESDFETRIKIAASVEKLLPEDENKRRGKLKKAYETVACSDLGKTANVGADAVRKIYKSAMQENDALVRLVASGLVEF